MSQIQRPYQNFKQFVASHSKGNINIIYPCFYCKGISKIYDTTTTTKLWNAFPGSRKLIQCPVCKGTGESSKKELKLKYKEIIRKWRRQK